MTIQALGYNVTPLMVISIGVRGTSHIPSIKTYFITYNVLKRIHDFVKTCTNFGILLNKILLINISFPNFYFLNVLLKNLKENYERYKSMQIKYI
jgi:hypothetical protein